ncbi:MAG: transcriptional regulator [Labilithrix sp.]|nr:transcriptional regulator [Labilithrix sp.]MBX3222604.1 transcriptional regulator [Labilithrix sp.]
MTPARPLSSAFAGGAGLAGEHDLEAVLHGLVARARAAWPDVRLDAEAFAAFLGRRVSPETLAEARAEDLWIACASAGADPAALAVVEARYLPDVDAALGKMGLGQDRIAEVKQGLRRLLFVGDGQTPPRIGDYRGSGDLRAWMRVTAMRAALKLLRKDGREAASDDALLAARAPDDDPELAYMKATYRAAFKTAFQEALESLQGRERTLLKQQIVDGLGIDELGALYEVHRATAARWVAAAREKLLLRTRRTFMLRARISSDECESIMRMVRSQLDVSLHRRLAAG